MHLNAVLHESVMVHELLKTQMGIEKGGFANREPYGPARAKNQSDAFHKQKRL